MPNRSSIAASLENRAMQARIIGKFWPVAAVVLVFFIVFSFFVLHDRVSGMVQTTSLALVVTAIPFCLRTGRVLLASNLLPGIGMLTIFSFLFTGGPGGEGFWWSIVYVVGVFLVTDKTWALRWLIFYFLAAALVTSLAHYNKVKIAYDTKEIAHLGFVYLVTLAFVYRFNAVRDYYLELARRRSKEMARINRELSVANRELEQLAYVASHDLQEPLQTLLNFTGLVEKEYGHKMDKEGVQYLRFISNASLKMKQLIKDILDHSRVGRNQNLTNVDCDALLREVLEQMAASVKESDAEIRWVTLPKLKGNKLELKLLFQNLISNAIKFRRKGVNPKLDISVKETGGHYLFYFKDNGIGIDEKHRDRIFVIFQRLHGDDEFPGTGIGLATCRKIVERHHGKIGLQSTPGEGSSFYFSLPIA